MLGTLPADVIVVTVSIALCLMVLVMMVRTMTRTILQALRVKGDERELMKMKAVHLLVLVNDTMTGHKLQGLGVDLVLCGLLPQEHMLLLLLANLLNFQDIKISSPMQLHRRLDFPTSIRVRPEMT